MTPNRTLVAALGLATAAALALAGCSAKSTSTPTHPASASDKLAAAIRMLNGTGFNFTLTEGAPGGEFVIGGAGSYDPSSAAATLDLKGNFFGSDGELAATEIGGGSVSPDQKMWAKINIGSLNSQYSLPRTKWMSLEPDKLSGQYPLPFDLSGQGDVLDVAGLLTSVTDVQVPPSKPVINGPFITGLVDLTKATGVTAPEPEDLSGLAGKATAVPFTATLDQQGRLTGLTIDTRSFSKELFRVLTFSDYGSPHAIKPPSPVVVATAKNYGFFNS